MGLRHRLDQKINVGVQVNSKKFFQKIVIFGAYSLIALIVVFAIGALLYVNEVNNGVGDIMSLIAKAGVFILVVTPIPLLVNNYLRNKITLFQFVFSLLLLGSVGVGFFFG